MYPAEEDDTKFNPNGFDHRITILFRYSTPAIRKYGPGKKANKAGHREQYDKAQAKWKQEHGQSADKQAGLKEEMAAISFDSVSWTA